MHLIWTTPLTQPSCSPSFPPLRNPTFLYDASGRDCLNTLEDFIGQQNPDGLARLGIAFLPGVLFQRALWGLTFLCAKDSLLPPTFSAFADPATRWFGE